MCQPVSDQFPYPARICSPAQCEPAFSCGQWLARSHCWSKGCQVQIERCSNLANGHSNAEAGRAIVPWQSGPDSAKNGDQAIVSKVRIKSCCPRVAGGRSVVEFLPAPIAIPWGGFLV